MCFVEQFTLMLFSSASLSQLVSIQRVSSLGRALILAAYEAQVVVLLGFSGAMMGSLEKEN